MVTDEKILNMIKQDPEKGAKLLFEKYLPVVRSVCSQKLNNREDVDECINDVFAEFCLKYQEYDEKKGTLKNYLCIIAERRAIDKYRRNRRKGNAELKVIENYKEEITEKENQAELREKLEDAMEKIDPLDRKILEKHYYEGVGYKEIAKELDMNYEAVKKRGGRSKKKLLYLILLGLLVFAITACATVVMKSKGILPMWFPFYDLIPKLEEDIKEMPKEQKGALYWDIQEKLVLVEEEQEIQEQESDLVIESENIKKYQITNMHGLMWSDEIAYEMVPNNQKLQKDDMLYELKDVFYQNGKWEIQIIVEYSGPEREIFERYVQGEITREEWIELAREKNAWLRDGETYLEMAYLLFENDEKCYLRHQSSENIDIENEYRYVLFYTTESVRDVYDKSDRISLVLPHGAFFEFIMEEVQVEEYEEVAGDEIDTEEIKLNEEIKIEAGLTKLEDNQAIVGVCQKSVGEYKVAPMLTQDYFGPIGIEQKTPSLRDRDGNVYCRMRVNMQDIGEDRMFEVYFRNIEPGEYTFCIPYLCLLKEMKTEIIELPLPAGEIEYLECDIIVGFPDGTGFRIKKIKRHEIVEEVYYEDDGVLTKEEQRYWVYEISYELLGGTEAENDYIFNVARATGKTSNGGEVVSGIRNVENEMKYFLKTDSAELSESMKVQFYDPLYFWDKEFEFDIVL